MWEASSHIVCAVRTQRDECSSSPFYSPWIPRLCTDATMLSMTHLTQSRNSSKDMLRDVCLLGNPGSCHAESHY